MLNFVREKYHIVRTSQHNNINKGKDYEIFLVPVCTETQLR